MPRRLHRQRILGHVSFFPNAASWYHHGFSQVLFSRHATWQATPARQLSRSTENVPTATCSGYRSRISAWIRCPLKIWHVNDEAITQPSPLDGICGAVWHCWRRTLCRFDCRRSMLLPVQAVQTGNPCSNVFWINKYFIQFLKWKFILEKFLEYKFKVSDLVNFRNSWKISNKVKKFLRKDM